MKKSVIIAGSGRGSAFAQRIIREGRRNVAAMVDTNTAIHDKLRNRFDTEYGSPDTVVCTTLTEALARFPKEVADTVLIVTPNHTHEALLKEALAAGRHVMLEKPVTSDPADLPKIARLANHTGQVIQLGFVLRYSPFWHTVIERCRSGKLGTIGMIQQNEWVDFAHSGNAYRRGWRRKQSATGGFLNEKCSHDLDLICAYKGAQAEPERVYSVAGRQMFPERKDMPEKCSQCTDAPCPFRYQEPPPGNPHYQLATEDLGNCVYRTDADVFNIQSVTLTFGDGTQGILTLIPYTGGEAHRSVTIHGTEGCLRGYQSESTSSLEVAIYRESGMEFRPVDLTLTEDGHGGGDSFITNDLFDCIEQNRKPEATVYDGLRASLLAFAADESARTGLPVDVKQQLQELKNA